MSGITIKDIAQKAGVSISTVSKALNDTGSVSIEMVERIKEIAKELDYEPNFRARSLAKGATGVVAFVADFPLDAAFVNPHIFEIIRGLEHALAKDDVALQIKQVAPKEAIIVLDKLIKSKSVDALVIHASILNKRLGAFLLKSNISFLIIGQPDFDSRLCWIDTNNSLSGEIAAKHLLDKGYDSIVFIAGRSDDMISNHRLKGVNKGLQLEGKEISKDKVYYSESTIYSGHYIAKKILKQKVRPRAIICANNVIAFGVIEEIQSQGLKVPEDIAVIAFDIYPFSRYAEPQITVIDIDMFALGYDAGRNILTLIKKPELLIQSFTTKPYLVQGGSS